MTRLRIATRESNLSRTQTRIVVEMLSRRVPGLEVEVVPVRTLGDRLPPERRGAVDGKTAFTGDIEKLLLEGEVDAAVHSMKDLPVSLMRGLEVGATPPRGDPRDSLVSVHREALRDLPPHAAVGTSSLRRKAQLLNLRRDLTVVELHGNVESRMAKMETLGLDAVVLATAGLQRISAGEKISQSFSIDEMVPAAGQATLAVEVRERDGEVAKVVSTIDDEGARLESECERAFTEAVGGDCNVPVGACARLHGGSLTVVGMVASPDGIVCLKDTLTSSATEGRALGRRLGEGLLQRGGEEVLGRLAR